MSPPLSTDPTAAGALPEVPGHVLTELIGRGASSQVWAARAESSGEMVAVKITVAMAHESSGVVDLAARERTILERVDSDHVVRLHEALTLEDGSVALVLDLADGGSLEDLVSIRGALDPGEVVTIFTPVATTLGALHAAGVIHSDLSPGNVLFTRDGKPMLSDYDGARLVGEQHPHTVSGTRGFVAPEVYRGGLPTEASDVWSLAALAWYAVTGGSTPHPENAGTSAEATTGPDFAPVLASMLSADPGARPTAAQAAVAFYRVAVPAPVGLAGRNPDLATAMTHRVRQGVTNPPAHPGQPGHPWSATPPIGPRRQAARAAGARDLSVTTRLGLVLGAAVVFTAGLLFLLSRQHSEVTGSPTLAGATGRASIATPTAVTTQGAAVGAVAQLRSDPPSALQTLADARASALVSGDPAQLLLVDVEGSNAHKADLVIMDQLKGQGQRYADLVFHVRSAEVVGVDDTSAQVLAVIDRAPYTVIGPGGAREQPPAQEGRSYRYSLALTGGDWRLTDIAEG